SFDMVVQTMYQTGIDMSHRYKETSEAGLASLYPELPEEGDFYCFGRN
ncbi:MAG: L-serine ammonia-lyase, iron-sulfur-dependent, subunit alpha, partial [Clostridia bacterium]|nr:L-serine ammonia-lyase, iron-sulfur-dependent, subunit alpha [Clostridia bacterium]